MIDLSMHIPAHKESGFIKFVLDEYKIDKEDLTSENVGQYVSWFIYGKDEPEKVEVKKEVVKIVKSEEEVFDEVVKSKLHHVDWETVNEISWMPAVTKDTVDYIYAIEVHTRKDMLKRIVLRDKEKSLRFLSHINKLFIRALHEQNKRNLH